MKLESFSTRILADERPRGPKRGINAVIAIRAILDGMQSCYSRRFSMDAQDQAHRALDAVLGNASDAAVMKAIRALDARVARRFAWELRLSRSARSIRKLKVA